MKRLLIALVALALAGCGSTKHTATQAQSKYSRFTANVTNPWFPLRPGSVYVYRGVKDRKQSRDVMTVTHETKAVDGAEVRIVRDLLYLHGKLEEHTEDWYTQDPKGNVWYFGERTAELDEHGHVKTTEGSWTAGVDGAVPGVFMFARTKVGDSARQEYYKGQAEDHFRVVRIDGDRLITNEWTPLEPGVLDAKFYKRGIGTILEVTLKGGDERWALKKVQTAR